ncbi:DNA-binding protein WhiA [Erysipelotrichaceae bacterium OttesenSCG-928-M19]|nr:DNA-binding protein WhiA [Erysipelotrichaceae bacterium OttesenSCG-928-M19]
MSFSREVKVELCQNELPKCCKKAFISAIIKMNSSLGINNKGMSINISFENVAIIRYIYEILKELYEIDTQIVVSKQMRLKKGNIYTLKIIDKALFILDDLKLMDGYQFKNSIDESFIKESCCRKAYIAGSFVAAGSVNSPQNSNYHLEIQSDDQAYLNNLNSLINYVNKGKYPLNINFKLIKRRKNYVLYLKSSVEIVDFLNYLGAINATFKFEDVRLQRDFVNSINRMNNMDVANEQKAQQAAFKQIEYIKKIDKYLGIDKLEDKLKEIAILRLENPEASLTELCEVYNKNNINKISKSGMNHRLRKIKERAIQINLRGDENGEE